MLRIESLLSARLFLQPQLVGDRIYLRHSAGLAAPRTESEQGTQRRWSRLYVRFAPPRPIRAHRLRGRSVVGAVDRGRSAPQEFLPSAQCAARLRHSKCSRHGYLASRAQVSIIRAAGAIFSPGFRTLGIYSRRRSGRDGHDLADDWLGFWQSGER